MKQILIVEDDHQIAEAISELLGREGFRCSVAHSVSDAEASVRESIDDGRLPDIVLLDWMLPDEPGVDLLRRWRNQEGPMRTVPVIFVSARVEVLDRVLGLELGAEDYITKPFAPAELVARVRARLRTSTHDGKIQLCHRGIALDVTSREVVHSGALVELTAMEFDLLRLLMEHPGRVFGREELLNRIWGYDRAPTTRTVDTHVYSLRNKLGAEHIESVRGVGYRMRRAVES